MNFISRLNIEELNNGKIHFAELVKILLIKHNEELIALLDLDNDDIFLDPLLFAYFNDSDPEAKVTIEQLVYGYIAKDLRPKKINILFDENKITYLPNIGYFKAVNEINTALHYIFRESSNGTYNISLGRENIEYDFFKIIYLEEDEKIELVQFQHPLLNQYFKINSPRYENQGNLADIEVNDVALNQKQNIKNALLFLKQHFSVLYETILNSNRKIFVFDNQATLCFTHQNLMGISFLSTKYSDGIIFFLEEIIHQGSHNMFNLMFYDKFKYFKIDFETEMLGKHIDDPNETRTLFNVFHGLITVSQRLICYKYIIERNLLQNEELHELTGRYCDQFKRLNSGLEKIDPIILYTDSGYLLYTEMRKVSEEALLYFKSKYKNYNLTNQTGEFNYENFKSLNTYKN